MTGAEPDLDAVGLLADGAGDGMDQAREVVSKTSIRIIEFIDVVDGRES